MGNDFCQKSWMMPAMNPPTVMVVAPRIIVVRRAESIVFGAAGVRAVGVRVVVWLRIRVMSQVVAQHMMMGRTTSLAVVFSVPKSVPAQTSFGLNAMALNSAWLNASGHTRR